LLKHRLLSSHGGAFKLGTRHELQMIENILALPFSAGGDFPHPVRDHPRARQWKGKGVSVQIHELIHPQLVLNLPAVSLGVDNCDCPHHWTGILTPIRCLINRAAGQARAGCLI